MTEPASRPPLAGGIFIFLGMLIGAGIGLYYRQPSLGMVIGLGVGIAAALLVWLLNSRR